jgi:hypothetical protein
MMAMLPRLCAALMFSLCCLQAAQAQDLSLQPKYGGVQKSSAQQAADAQFLARVDELYKGDRKQAAEDVALKGWGSLHQGDASGAMRRFNQSWLLDQGNGKALWGMAMVEAGSGQRSEALALFAEAEKIVGADPRFASDYARAKGQTQ